MYTKTTNEIFSVETEKITIQEAAMLYYMFQKENTIGRCCDFRISEFSDHFDNETLENEWTFSRDVLVLSGVVDFTDESKKFHLTEYGTTLVSENFSQIDALSAIYEGGYINSIEEC